MSSLSPLLRHFIFVSFLVYCVSPLTVSAQDEYVQVRLLRDAGPRTIVVSSTDDLYLYSVGIENPISQVRSNEKLTLTTSNDRVYMTSRDGGIYASNLVMVQQEGAELTIEIADGASRVPPRTYRGAFQVEAEQPSRLKIVNVVPLEDYVTSVVSSEFGFDELEAAKAVALCVRTLALKSLITQTEPNFAVADDESWQVYRGTAPVTQTAIEATMATQGQVLLHNNQLIDAVYFASSGGMTANNEDVWNTTVQAPYLRGKTDAYDFSSPHSSWTQTIPRAQLLDHLSSLYDDQRITNISIGSLFRSDKRVKTMRLVTAQNNELSLSGTEFRHVVNQRFGRETLKSTMFVMEELSGRYVFTGSGYGHGVGLNQWGALELSRRGQLYDEILNFYYTDIDIQHFELMGTESFTLENRVETEDITNNIPVVDWNSPSATIINEPLEDTPFSSASNDIVYPASLPDSTTGGTSKRDLLGFGPEEESTATDTGTNPRERRRNRQTKEKKRIYSDARIVGWSKTIDPDSTSSPDSVQTVPKRRSKGW